jgi:hypothetical protein
VAQVFECPECGGNHLIECVENVIIHFPVGRVVLYGFESRSRKAPYFDFSQATLSHYECANPECGYIPLDETGSPIDDNEKLYDWLLLNSKHSQEAEQDEESSLLTITGETEVQIAV